MAVAVVLTLAVVAVVLALAVVAVVLTLTAFRCFRNCYSKTSYHEPLAKVALIALESGTSVAVLAVLAF